MLNQKQSRDAVALCIVIIAAIIRMVQGFGSHNFYLFALTPVGAMFIFSSVSFPRTLTSFALPAMALFISDLVLCFTVYSGARHGLLYTGWYWTYGSLLLMGVVGRLLIRKITVGSILAAAIGACLVHWMVSNLGPCIESGHDNAFFEDYSARLLTAVGAELALLLGTLLYAGLFFGTMQIIFGKSFSSSHHPNFENAK